MRLIGVLTYMAVPACMTKRKLISYLLLDWRAVSKSEQSQIRLLQDGDEFYVIVVRTQGLLKSNNAGIS